MLDGRQAESWSELAARVGADAATVPTPFQAGHWLSAWYATLGSQDGVAPLPIEVLDTQSGKLVAAFPLVRRDVDNLTVIEFADLSVTDYNLPIYTDKAELRPADLMAALRGALPGADVLHLAKMPARWGRQANPLAIVEGALRSSHVANFVRIDESWEHYQRVTLAKKFRKEMERSLRVFVRDGDNARFETITCLDQAEWALVEMERLQEARISEKGLPFCLNDAPYRAFFRELLRSGLGDGSVVLTALRSKPDKLAAALIGIRDRDNYAMVRLAQDMENWSQCSPGKLVIERTMHALHAKGVRHFDFTTGDYTYKGGFGVVQEPLVDVRVALSFKGRMQLGRDSIVDGVKTRLRRYPRAYARIKTLTGARSTN